VVRACVESGLIVGIRRRVCCFLRVLRASQHVSIRLLRNRDQQACRVALDNFSPAIFLSKSIRLAVASHRICYTLSDPASFRGTMMGIAHSTSAIARALSPVLGGAIYDAYPLVAFAIICAVGVMGAFLSRLGVKLPSKKSSAPETANVPAPVPAQGSEPGSETGPAPALTPKPTPTLPFTPSPASAPAPGLGSEPGTVPALASASGIEPAPTPATMPVGAKVTNADTSFVSSARVVAGNPSFEHTSKDLSERLP